MTEETEWTSIPVTAEQKAALAERKPEGMSWGYWLVEETVSRHFHTE